MPPIRLPEVLDALPIFPLPNLVLLPGEMVPLHVFEPRYQALIAHCMENDRVLGMATLVPGFEQEYEGRPPVFPEVAVAAILQHQPLPEGRSNLLIQSVARIRLVEELPATRLFREIRGTVCEEVDDRPSLDGLRSMMVQLGTAFPGSSEDLGRLLGFDGRLLVDLLASKLLVGVEARLAYVRTDRLSGRLRLVERALAKKLPMSAGSAEA